MIQNKFNPWENSQNFVQDVGEVKSFLSFLEKNKIDLFVSNKTKYLQINDSSESLSLLESLNEISKSPENKIKIMNSLLKIAEKYTLN
jgi:hypothetical protein